MLLSKERPDDKIKHLVFWLMCSSAIAASACISTDGTFSTIHIFGLSVPLRGICFFRLFTGYRCPVCGMTRCFSYMAHGKIAAAWQMSHAGIPLFLLCAYESIYRLARLIFRKFRFYKAFIVIEAILIVISCAAVVFFFAAQFVNPNL